MRLEKICHISDLHIRKSTSRNEEYLQVFDNLIKSVKLKQPSRIIIVGDIVHDYLQLQPEQLIIVSKLLNDLANIAPVRITQGNHDVLKNNKNRIDSIKAIVETLNNSNIRYYDKTGFYQDEDIMWVVWHHSDKINPWKTKDGKKIDVDSDSNITYIDLFHDPVNGSKLPNGLEMKSKSYYKISDFKGHFTLLGDIHRQQFLNKEKTIAYSGSLIAQDFSEGDDQFHGYLLWDINKKTVEEISINNDYSFKNIRITPYIDFDDLDFEIENPTKYIRVRFIWGTLPQSRTSENERKLIAYIKNKHNIISISNKNEFLEQDKIEVNQNVTLDNIKDKGIQQEIFKEYLNKIGTEENVIEDVFILDDEITTSLASIDDANITWDILKFGGKNFMSYETLDIDWRDKDGLFQIIGSNAAGKTTAIFKLIPYILFGKTLETETRVKFGDIRFVNNRNNATFCEGYIVIEANGEYYGIKRRTDITKSKDGVVNGSPTTLNYYLLSSPDDEMNEDSSIDKLDEDRKAKTQKKLAGIVGDYEGFSRILTTSDTLNKILSNDMAVFIDSLLFDSGLDIFDKKLEEFKLYQKRVNEKNRVTCNIEITTNQNAILNQEIVTLEGEINNIETNILPEIKNRINNGKTYLETLTKKLFKIDPEIYNLNVVNTQFDINTHRKGIVDLNTRKVILESGIAALKETYNEVRLNELLVKKEEHKTNEYSEKLKIKNIEQEIRDNEHQIEIINGDIYRLKQQGVTKKQKISDLKNSKTCPTCGQLLTIDHQTHIDNEIKSIETEMFSIANDIKTKENVDKINYANIIATKKIAIESIKNKIETTSLEMESVLAEIGVLTNDKNDVEKRKEYQNELDQIPNKIENFNLKISILQNKIDNHENSLKQIEENHNIEKGIAATKIKISELETNETDEKENIFIRKTSIGEKVSKIKSNIDLITTFKEQEYRDMVMNLYKKCVHRDGIPRQMLSNYILPKINLTLENILTVAPFKVWLDPDDLKPKLAYNNRNAVIDCISASGKERTFSSIVLKFALNLINVRSKPNIIMLDEIMGKLDDDSAEEFTEILQLIKNNMNKVIIVEHVRGVSPDYTIDVQLNADGISSLTLE